MTAPKDATEATRRAQAAARAALPRESGEDSTDVRRGFIATLDQPVIRNDAGAAVWSLGHPDTEGGRTSPDTVHPGLWRQAGLNAVHGLFRVIEGVYQVRGFDLANVTFLAGHAGYVVVDPLTSAETARAALELVRKHLGARPVTGVVYTHSHVDHYGGIRGILSEAQIASGEIPILAPAGFLEHAVSENVLAGNAMNRRATYMYGALLPPGPRGHVDVGLGKSVSLGSVSLAAPTEVISSTGTRRELDGVELTFQLTPDTEAPAEMNFFLPRSGALCIAENATAHLHNLYTPRGAPVRDARAWSRYLDEAIDLFGADTTVVFGCHHWPRWGRRRAIAYLAQQRDLYRYIHDQTLRLANHGLTPEEIAEQLELPPGLAAEWHTRGLYGTLSHNAKAVYQRYLGWFDGNPAHLHPLPPEQAGRRYVAFMGGPEVLLERARKSFQAGDYRWVVQVVNHLVFADPGNDAARELQADALEQLGYQAESGPWRGFYLTAAQELRNPRPPAASPRPGPSGMLRALPARSLLETMAVRLNGPAAGDRRLSVRLVIRDTGEEYLLRLEHGVLHHYPVRRDPRVDAAATLRRATLAALLLEETTPAEARQTGELSLTGDASAFEDLFALLDRFDFWFEIAAP